MALLGLGQQAIVMPHYPHMMAEDTEVWTKFLKSGFIRIQRVWYDVRVGLSVLHAVGGSDLDKRIADGLTRKRIDVVASIAGGFWVVEVKPRCNMYALGQVLTYQRLFVREYVTRGAVVPVVVCDEFDDDLLDEIDELGILVLKNN